MPLESCMILLDNSQYMRNGDYIPNRLGAQQDAANLLIRHKTQSNPESTVGVIAMNGGCFTAGVELLVSPTDDVGKLMSALNDVPIRGSGALVSNVDVPASVQVASLALKHRRNKNGQQRIVIFIGSPLTHVEKKALVKAGKALKKNNVAIDVVSMGESEGNEEKLKDLVDAVNGNNDEKLSHLVTIPVGTLPSDVLVSSPVVHGGDVPMGGGGGGVGPPAAGAGGGGGGNDFAEYGGVDPSLDPELAMALRISMEEERLRQERISREQQASNENEEAKDGDSTPLSGEEAKQEEDTDVNMEEIASAPDVGVEASMMDTMGDEDALLQQALAMSMAENNPLKEETSAESPAADMEEDDDDEAMNMALAMSMAETGGDSAKSQQFQDPQFVNQLLGSMPGVDPNDPSIKSALEGLEKANQKDDSNDDKKDEGSDKKE